MIVDHENKIILFTLPRTGSNSIRHFTAVHRLGAEAAKSPYTADEQAHNSNNAIMIDRVHGPYVWFVDNIVNEKWKINDDIRGRTHSSFYGFTSKNQFDQYEKFAFYREPYDRCMSALNLVRRGRLHHIYYNMLNPYNQMPACDRSDNYEEWSQSKKDMMDSEPTIEVFRRMKGLFKGKPAPVRSGHMGYFEGDVQPLDFRNFEPEARKIFAKMGLPITEPIPRIGRTVKLPQDEPSPSEKQEIKDFFAEDYEYLDSKGITFP